MTRGTIPGIDPGRVAITGIDLTTITTDKTMPRLFVLICSTLLLLLSGCASSPKFDTNHYATSIQPDQVAESFSTYQNQNILWGGRIVSSANLADGTQLEVLGHPLSSNQLPDTNRDSTGRFLIFSSDFLEPLDFTEGRLITVAGQLDQLQDGKIGAVEYQYPVLNSEQIHLWSAREMSGNPRVHVGFGFLFGN